MATEVERREFLAGLYEEYGYSHELEYAGLLLLRHGVAHHRIQERWCNEEMSDATVDMVTKKEEQLERRIREIVANNLPTAAVEFQGDPRGYTVRLTLPSGRSNSWDRKTYGVPV